MPEGKHAFSYDVFLYHQYKPKTATYREEKWKRMQMVWRRGRQLRCAPQAIHGTGTRQLSYQESQFMLLTVLLINLELEMLHVLDLLKLTAYKNIGHEKKKIFLLILQCIAAGETFCRPRRN